MDSRHHKRTNLALCVMIQDDSRTCRYKSDVVHMVVWEGGTAISSWRLSIVKLLWLQIFNGGHATWVPAMTVTPPKDLEIDGTL